MNRPEPPPSRLVREDGLTPLQAAKRRRTLLTYGSGAVTLFLIGVEFANPTGLGGLVLAVNGICLGISIGIRGRA